ncbi:hypothetical protein INR49_002262 [Caranx melampygus]|nr:hypothetical protein INR49_002262 [Caranx melampygus]
MNQQDTSSRTHPAGLLGSAMLSLSGLPPSIVPWHSSMAFFCSVSSPNLTKPASSRLSSFTSCFRDMVAVVTEGGGGGEWSRGGLEGQCEECLGLGIWWKRMNSRTFIIWAW